MGRPVTRGGQCTPFSLETPTGSQSLSFFDRRCPVPTLRGLTIRRGLGPEKDPERGSVYDLDHHDSGQECLISPSRQT